MTHPVIRQTMAGLRAFAAIVVVGALAGCGGESATGPVAAPSVDLNAVVSALSATGIKGYSTARAMTDLPVPLKLPSIPANACPYAGAAGFVCPTWTSGGVTFDVSYYLFDGTGAAEAHFAPTATDGVGVVSSTAGTVEIPTTNGIGGAVAITDRSNVSLTGLLGANQTLNGSSTSHYDAVLTGAAIAHVAIDVTTAESNVVFPSATAAVAWPLSGTITSDQTLTETIGALPITTAIHIVVAFNGTSQPTVSVTGGGATLRCTLDLARTGVPTCR